MRSTMLGRAFALAGAALIISTTTVFADDISNSLDGSIDAVAEVMPLTVGGADGETTLYVQPRNGDGKNGCNLSSGELVVSVSSSDTDFATVSPTSVTFGACGDIATLTISPVAAGTATISVAETSNSSGGTFNLAPATFTVNVSPPPNTAPSISITGVDAGGTYEAGSVPAAICNITDAEDGPSSFAATLSAITGPLAAYGLGSQTASCSFTDGGGLTASSSVIYSIVDTIAPSVGHFIAGAQYIGFEPWYASATVTVTWSYSDVGPVAPLTVVGCVTPTVISADGTFALGCSVTDVAGNTTTDNVSISHDATPPSIVAARSVAANANGWNNESVTVSYTCTDATSGLLVSPVTVGSSTYATDCADDSFVAETTTAGVFGYAQAYDQAGNFASVSPGPIKIDTTAPSVGLVGGPSDGASYYFGSVPAAPTCSASDALSGLDGPCSVGGYSSAVGTHTVTASASDLAENTADASATYTVLAWDLLGFYQPVDMGEVWNTVKNGSTVPLKFEMFAGPTELTSPADVTGFAATPVACPVNGFVADAIEVLATGGTVLRYDSTAGQFVYNWQTPKKAGSCYMVTMTAADGSTLGANFILK